ncbi:MAG: type III secretion system chaperone [Succinivibrio sp.]|nr:type III secretion system chaperone [Succinivibrio sp.]
MQVQEIFKTLGQRIGLSLSLTDEQTCSVLFDGDEVRFEVQDSQLFIYAEVGSLAGREDLYIRLLGANHLGQWSGFGSLGLDENKELLTLTRVLVLECSYAAFERELTLFIKVLRYWKTFLQEN